MGLSLVRYEHIYQAIKEENESHNYSIVSLCKLGKVSRSAYYKWLNRRISENELKNTLIADEIEKINIESPDMGYRRIRDDLERYHDINVNDKRVLHKRSVLTFILCFTVIEDFNILIECFMPSLRELV